MMVFPLALERKKGVGVFRYDSHLLMVELNRKCEKRTCFSLPKIRYLPHRSGRDKHVVIDNKSEVGVCAETKIAVVGYCTDEHCYAPKAQKVPKIDLRAYGLTSRGFLDVPVQWRCAVLDKTRVKQVCTEIGHRTRRSDKRRQDRRTRCWLLP